MLLTSILKLTSSLKPKIPIINTAETEGGVAGLFRIIVKQKTNATDVKIANKRFIKSI
jgi:hypothetical protein